MAQSESARTVLEQLVRDRSDLFSVFREKIDLINAHFTKEFQLYAKRLPPLTSVEREAFKAELQKAGGANPMIDTLPQALQPSEVLEQRLAELKKTESMKTVLVSGVKERDRLVALDKSSTSVKLLNMSLRAAVGTSEALKLLGDRECKRIVQSIWPVESFQNFVQSEAELIHATGVGSVRNFLEKVEKELIEVKSEADESELDKVLADVVRVNPTLAAAVRAEGTTFLNRWLPVSSGEETNLPETLNQQFQQGLSETVAGSVRLDSVVVEPRSKPRSAEVQKQIQTFANEFMEIRNQGSTFATEEQRDVVENIPSQEMEKGAFPTGESREAIRSLGEARKSLEAGCSEALKNINEVNAAEKSARLGKIHFLLSQVKEREAAYQFVIRKLKDINRQVWKDLVWDEQPEGVKELLLKAGRAPVSIHALYYVLNNINVNVMVSPADPAAVKSIVGSLIRAEAEILQLMDLIKDASLKPALAVALAQRGVTRNHFALTDQQLKSVAIEGKERRMYDAILEGLEVSVRKAAAIVKAKKVEEIDAHIAQLDGLVIQDSITKNPECKKRIEKEWLKLAPLSRKLVISMDPSVVPPPVLMAGYVIAHAKVWTWRNDGAAMLQQLAAYEKTFTDKQVKVRTEMVAAVHSTGLAHLLPKDSSDPLEKEIIGAVNKKKLFSNKPAIDLRNHKELLKCASERSVVLLVDPDVLVRERVEAYVERFASALQASGEPQPELVQEYLDAIAAERKSLSDFVDRDDSVPPGEKDKQKQTLLESFSRVVSDVQASNPLVSAALAMEGFRDFGKSIVPQSNDDKIDRVIGSGGPAPAVNAAASATDLESILLEQSIETRTQVAKALSEIKRFSGDETAPIGTDPIDTMVDRSQENIGELVKGGDQDTLEAAQVAKAVTQRWEMPEKVRQEFVADINNANAVWEAKCKSDYHVVRRLSGYNIYTNMAALGDFLVNVGLAMRKQLLKIKLIDREDAKAQLRKELEVHLPTNLREQLHAKGNTPEFTTGDQLLGIHPSTGRSGYWWVPVKCVSDQELMVDYVKKAEALLLLAENNLSQAAALVPELREKASEIARNADPANTVFGKISSDSWS